MDEEGKYMDKYDYKMFMDYHDKFLKDNKKSFSTKDYNYYSNQHKKYSNDYPNHHEKCDCHGEKEDHERHYYDSKEYYDKNKNKFGKGDYSKHMNDYEDYFNENGKYMDSSDFKMFMDYHEKFLKDNKKYFSDSDYRHHSEEHEKYSRDHPKHEEEENECKEKSGFFVGGGKVYVPKFGGTYQLTHGFELHCDKTQAPNNLEINWQGHKFHLEQLVKATCIDDDSPNEPPPSPHPGPKLDIYDGEGYGRYDGTCGYYAEWEMSDNGEPGKDDEIISLQIKNPITGEEVLNIGPIALKLKTGNHQFVPHPSTHPNPPTQTNPCPRVP